MTELTAILARADAYQGWVPVDQVPEDWRDERTLAAWATVHGSYGYTPDETKQCRVRWFRGHPRSGWIPAEAMGNYYHGLTVLFVRERFPDPNKPDPTATLIRDLRSALVAAGERETALREALAYYSKTFCEGFCDEYGPKFDDDTCSGCRARRALEGN